MKERRGNAGWRHRISEKLSRLLGRAALQAEQPDELDTEFYRAYYPDLAALDTQSVMRHWCEHGIAEKRYPNIDAMLKASGKMTLVPASFDWRIYLACYPDLGRAGLSSHTHALLHFLEHGIREGRSGNFNHEFYTEFYPDLEIFRDDRDAAIEHWLMHGDKEGRSPTLAHYVETQGLPGKLVPDEMEWMRQGGWSEQCHRQELDSRRERWRTLAQAFAQEPSGILPIWEDSARNAAFYLELASAYVGKGGDQKARGIYLGLCGGVHDDVVHEELGNIAVRASWRESDHGARERKQLLALAHYQLAVAHNSAAVNARLGVVRALSETCRHDEALEQAKHLLEEHPGTRRIERALIRAAFEYWWGEWASVDALAVAGNRQAVYDKASELARVVADACRHMVTRGNSEHWLGPQRYNCSRVLIVADMHLPQCVRYRVDQKVEQLQIAGYQVTTESWTHAESALQQLAFHDIVIFYRVPGLPQVVELIAVAKTLGKLTFFEIDDYVFDPVYPPPIESYGGYVTPQQYIELVKGGALFRAAAQLCDFGIASTLPLVEHLAKVVDSGRCFLHRNALDQKTPMGLGANVLDESSGINIFYGSATFAHNSDFINEALPAISRVLEENPEVKFTVAGHLRLPPEFRARFPDQHVQLPMMRDLDDYWAAMAKSHINIAVLSSDMITDCKSELKWFEAAVLGIPVIVSPTRNYLDVIDDGSDALIATGPESWYEALTRLVASGSERSRIGSLARSRVLREYSLEAMAENLAGIFRQAGCDQGAHGKLPVRGVS